MKKVLVIFLFVIGCEKNTDLTEIQNNGEGGISCLVNGEVLRPGTSLYGRVEHLDIYFDQGVRYLSLGFFNKNSNGDWKIIEMKVPNIEFYNPTTLKKQSIVGTYDLTENNGINSYGTYDTNVSDSKPTFTTTNENVGKLIINYHDVDNFIVSGTFSYDAIDENGNIVKITEGRFDKEIGD